MKSKGVVPFQQKNVKNSHFGRSHQRINKRIVVNLVFVLFQAYFGDLVTSTSSGSTKELNSFQEL